MSDLILEILFVHPPEVDKEVVEFGRRSIGESEIHIWQSFEYTINAALSEDLRPLVLAIRRRQGDTSGLSQSLWTFVFKHPLEKSETRHITFATQIIDIHSTIGSDFDWHFFWLGHVPAGDIHRLKILWNIDSFNFQPVIGSDVPPVPAPTTLTISSVTVAFTDGDTMRRVTVVDPLVTATSKILGTICRPDTASDSADRGYLYTANVVRRYVGGFELLVVATAWDLEPTQEIAPNETVTYFYMVG